VAAKRFTKTLKIFNAGSAVGQNKHPIFKKTIKMGAQRDAMGA
jgi:hypothetical protein